MNGRLTVRAVIEELGPDRGVQFMRRWGGQRVPTFSARRLALFRRNQAIRAAIDKATCPLATIAVRYGLSLRQVKYISKKVH